MSETIEANVAIIGAGPAGTAAAAHLGQLGVRDVVLVDRADFPRDKTCGSGISPKGIEVLRDLGVWRQIEPSAYWIKGIRIVTPAGYESVQSAGSDVEAIICHRRTFDHVLLKSAVARGTRFVPNFSAAQAIEEDGRVKGFVARDGTEVRARYTIVAGGSHCRIGVNNDKPRQVINAIMGWWDDVAFTPNVVEMIFDKMVVPYYGWLFPEGDKRVNIGITYEDPDNAKNARQLFQAFLDKHYTQRMANATQVGGWKGHPIHYSYNVKDLTGPGRFVIGEAGLMTHPATAEGIYQGMKSGMLSAEAVADILSGRFTESESMRSYEARCKQAFQMSFLGGRVFRRLLKTPALDWAVRFGEQAFVKSGAARVMAHM
ncbi:MAG: NAD(P)/FAD-dependent oxidoreductase [Myxococcota bacterium]